MRTKDRLDKQEETIAELRDIVNDLRKQIKKLNDPLDQHRRRIVDELTSFNTNIEKNIQTLGWNLALCPEDYARVCKLRRATKSLALAIEDLKALA